MLILAALLGGLIASLFTITSKGFGAHIVHLRSIAFPVLRLQWQKLFFLILLDLGISALFLGSAIGYMLTSFPCLFPPNSLNLPKDWMLYSTGGFIAVLGAGLIPFNLLPLRLQNILTSDLANSHAKTIPGGVDFNQEDKTELFVGYGVQFASQSIKEIHVKHQRWRCRVMEQVSASTAVRVGKFQYRLRSKLRHAWFDEKERASDCKYELVDRCSLLSGENWRMIRERAQDISDRIIGDSRVLKVSPDTYVREGCGPSVDDQLDTLLLVLKQNQLELLSDILKIEMSWSDSPEK